MLPIEEGLMRRASAYVVLTLMLLGLLACGSDDAPSMHASLFGEPLDDEMRTALRSELEEAQSRWRQADIGAYRVDVVRGGLLKERYRIQVEGDSIRSAVRFQDGDFRVLIPRKFSMYDREDDSIYAMLGTSADSLYSSAVAGLPTVSFLFRLLDNAVDSAFSMAVEYDPDLGYPRRVLVDYSSTTLDEESIYSVREFELIQGR